MSQALQERVRELADGTTPPVAALDGRPAAEQEALAWALKDEAIASWTSDPDRTRRCAAALAWLARASPAPEVQAAAAWGAGMEQLTRGEMDKALDSFDIAGRTLEALGQELRAAQSQIPRLIALSMLGRHDEAVACAERVRARLIEGGDELGAGKTELNLGSMLLRQDRHEAAASFYRQAAVRFARAGDVRYSIMADIGLAGALTWLYEFDEAQRLYDRAAMRVRSRQLHDLQGVIDTNRGRLELHRGHFDAALACLDAAMREAEQHGMPHDVAETRRDLADAYLALNLLPESIALYDQTIAACEALDAPVERAWAELQRAQALARSGQPGLAAQGLGRARELLVTHGSAVGPTLADLRLADLRLELGDVDGAAALARDAAVAFADAGIDGWRAEAELLTARVLVAQGRDDDALQSMQRTLQAATALPEPTVACRTAIGRLLQRRGRTAEAREHFELAAQLMEQQRARLPGDEFRIAYLADRPPAHDARVELACRDTAPGSPVRLLETMERARAQSLASAIREPEEGSGVDPARREQLHWLQGQWQDALAQDEPERAQALQQRMRDIEQQWLEQQRRHAAAQGARRAASADGFDLSRLRDTLPDGAAWVQYALLGEQLAVVVVRGDTVRHAVLDARGLSDRIAGLRLQIDALRHGGALLARHAAQMHQRTRAHLQALHALLWQPLAAWVGDAERVFVVPHRDLHYVPFCALHDGERSLVDRHELALAPSAALWSASRDRRRRPGSPALRRVAAVGLGGAALPQVGAELRAVAAAFESRPGGSAVLRLDADATLGSLRDALAGADVVHLACHGTFRADSPAFSSLHLADGALTVRDAAGLPLQARLVTLSACETGLSRVAPGDELLGLLRGFLVAGAPQVLASQWTVDDSSTATLMRIFYARLLAGERAGAALRASQIELAALQPHPYHWAAFALHQRTRCDA